MAISTRHTVGNSDGYQPNFNIWKHKWDLQIWQYEVFPTIKRLRCSTPTVLGNISRMEVKSLWRASKLTEWPFPDLMAIVGPLWTSLVLPQSFLGVVNLLSTLVFPTFCTQHTCIMVIFQLKVFKMLSFVKKTSLHKFFSDMKAWLRGWAMVWWETSYRNRVWAMWECLCGKRHILYYFKTYTCADCTLCSPTHP